MTGIGPVAVRQSRVRDREADATDPDRIRFSPSILPPYMRRSKSIETLLPILYLKGISTGDFSESLAALLGKDAAGVSASAIGRLKDGWSTSTPRGRIAICRRSATFTFGPMASIWRRADRGRKAVHSRADRCDARRPQGTGRLHRWCPRERARLARSAVDLKRRGLDGSMCLRGSSSPMRTRLLEGRR